MTLRRVLFLVVFLGGVLLVSFLFFTRYRNSLMSYDFANVSIGDHEFVAEVADTPESRARGLSGHKPLSEDQGMLFLFPEASVQAFWMKEMLFPIDIIWIRDGRVLGFYENVPPPLPETSLSELLLYTSPGLVNMVFEVAGGTVSRFGITVGDKFVFQP